MLLVFSLPLNPLALITYRFDPDGFKEGNPLTRPIFYLTPYITCRGCNMVNYVDISAVRLSMTNPGDKISNESLPPCRTCGRVDLFEVGHHDFAEEIKRREEEMRKRKLKERGAVLCIQRSYRYYLRRMYGQANARAIIAERLRQAKAATSINAGVRGRLARRRVGVERLLLVIKCAHILLMDHALKPGPNRKKVFWYKRQEALQLLYKGL